MLTFAHIPTGPTTNRNRFISGRKSDNLSPAAARIARIQASRPRRDSLLTPPSRCPNIGVHLNQSTLTFSASMSTARRTPGLTPCSTRGSAFTLIFVSIILNQIIGAIFKQVFVPHQAESDYHAIRGNGAHLELMNRPTRSESG